MRSSTSSSELTFPGGGRPTALLLAVAIVVLIEAVLHLLPGETFYGYGRGMRAYYEVYNHVGDHGAAEVSIVGTSRGRESFVVPELSEGCGEWIGRPAEVANYSCADARADVLQLIVDHLLDSPRKPEVLVYMLSPTVLQGDAVHRGRLEIFADSPDWYDATDEQPLQRLTYRTAFTVRRLLNEHLLLFRHRHRFRQFCTDLVRRRDYPSPIQGGMTEWHTYNADKNIADWDIDDRAIRRGIRQLQDEEGRFRLSERQVGAFHATIRRCADAGVPVILVEAPLPEMVARHYPPELTRAMDGVIDEALALGDIAYLRIEDLDVDLEHSDFRELSHLNYLGASKLTGGILDEVCVRLGGRDGGGSATAGDGF